MGTVNAAANSFMRANVNHTQYPVPRDSEERRRILSDLARATYAGKRLASYRRVLGALLVTVGAPVIALNSSTSPAIRHAITILALVWLALVLPMVRLLCTEWQNNRLTEHLRVLVYTDDLSV
jgi:hypothetical protein